MRAGDISELEDRRAQLTKTKSDTVMFEVKNEHCTQDIISELEDTRAQRQELDTATEVVPETPPPATKPGRSRGRGTWRAQQKTAPGVGTRSRTKLAELEKRENAQAQAAHARWPPSPDIMENIQELPKELKLCDVPRNVHRELERVLPSGEDDMEQTPRQPPAAGLMTRHQDTYFIPPPRAVGGVRGKSAPVSTATLGLIHRQDPSLAAQLRGGPRIHDDTTDQTQSLQHHAPHVGPAGLPSNNGKRQ